MNSIGLAVAVVCGVALGLVMLAGYPGGLDTGYGWALLGLALAATMAATIARSNRRPLWTGLLVAFALAGLGRALLTHPPVTSADLAYYNSSPTGPTVEVQGIISSEPTFSDRAQSVRISATGIKTKSNTASLTIAGDMIAVVPRYPELAIGDNLLVSGKLTEPPSFSGFDYAAYLAGQGVFSYMNFPKVTARGSEDVGLDAYIIAQRIAARHTLQNALAEPEASIAVGVVTGDRTSISAAVQAAFRTSGTTHILAISGENITLMVGLLWLFFSGGPVKRRLPIVLAFTVILFILIYTLFTGATPSVVRAAIMAVVLLLGPIVGRRYDPMAALAVSAAIMVLFDPRLLGDAGFLLSFGAMFGIATVSPLLQAFLTQLRIPFMLSIPISVSLGAVAATIPLSALLIGQVSLVGPLATLTSDFALAPLMLSGIGAILLGVVSAQASAILGLLTWVSAGWLLASAQLWASLPFASVNTSGVTTFELAIYYVALIAVIAVLSNPQRRARLKLITPGAGTAVLAAGAVVVWVVALFLLVT